MRKRWGLALLIARYVFIVMAAAMSLAGTLVFLLDRTGFIDSGLHLNQVAFPFLGIFRALFPLMGFSILIGTILAGIFSKYALKPIHSVIAATKKIAQGDFDVQVKDTNIPELEELPRSFNKMARELGSIETLRSDFINNFSHEFKTPIVSIRGFAKLLKEENLTDEEKERYLEIIITESERLATLSTNVLTLSKYESTKIITEKVPFRLDEQIRRTLLLTESKWQEKQLELHIEMDEITFFGNKNLTQQIWINLIDNAIKFSNQGGNIEICLLDLCGTIYFSIQDGGIGMDEETTLRLFDKFYQGDKSRSGTGNGLGLAIVKQIVELCDGTITVDSSPGRGSKFAITLPD